VILNMVRAWFLVLAVLAGCELDGRELREWRLGERTITLPGGPQLGAIPEYAFTLHATVPLADDERGQLLTLYTPCYHASLGLRAAGVPLIDIGNTDVGEHRYIIPAESTTGASLDLELAVGEDVLSTGFGVAPRLQRGGNVRPSTVAVANRDLGIIDLGVIVLFSILFGISFALDRRRVQDLAAAVGMLFVSSAPLAQLGVVQGLGRMAPIAVALSICGGNISMLAFIHASFALPPPRRLVRVYALATITTPVIAIGSFVVAVWSVGMAVVGLVALRHLYLTLKRQWSGPRRVDAIVLSAMCAVVMVVITPDTITIMTGHALLGGVHLLSVGAIVFGLTQAIHVARELVARRRDLEHTSEELRRQIAARSRELGEALAKLSDHQLALEADRTIDGRYRVIRRLGAGGMGAVYEVERTSDRQRLALKTLRGRTDSEVLARFAREAQIAAALSHPNLLPVLDVGISDGALFLVMPLVPGGSLEDARGKFGDAEWAKPRLRQIAEGLGALHARDIVHRDLKPANILLDDATPRIADFGLAGLRGDSLGETLADTAAGTGSPLTRKGDVFGTPDYMAPELASGVENAKGSSDIFSFGVIAYEMLTGRRPFDEPALVARLHGRTIAPRAGADAIVMRCLSAEPAARPTARELARAF
jgi:hypothetical protein